MLSGNDVIDEIIAVSNKYMLMGSVNNSSLSNSQFTGGKKNSSLYCSKSPNWTSAHRSRDLTNTETSSFSPLSVDKEPPTRKNFPHGQPVLYVARAIKV